MSALTAVQTAALLSVADAIKSYADNMCIDVYGETRQYERDSHAQDQFHALAKHLQEIAVDSIEHFGDGT